MSDLPIPVLLMENEEYLMSNNDNDRERRDESLNQYYKRKMTTNVNRVSPDAEEPEINARDDYDAEQRQSNWEHGSGPKLSKGESIWDKEPWKDKDQHGR